MRLTTTVAFVACVLFGTSPALAQDAAPSFGSIRIARIPTVYVTDRSGREIAGKLAGVTDSEIALLVGTTRQTFAPAEVERIQLKGDSLKNGAIIGAVIGAVMTFAAAADCARSSYCSTGSSFGFGLLITGYATVLGAGIDWAIPRRTLLWEAPKSASGAVSFRVAPSRRGVVAGASIRW